MVFPSYIKGSGFDSAPSSLSLWKDIESLMAFAYAGVHAEALKHARNWNQKERLAAAGPVVGRLLGATPGLAARQLDKLEWLHDHGAKPASVYLQAGLTSPDGAAYGHRSAAADKGVARCQCDRVKADLLEQVEAIPV
jgi:hypothetical protein